VPLPSAAVFQPAKFKPVLVKPDPEFREKVLEAEPDQLTAVGAVPVAPFAL
jgi:hypothetical protein